MACRQSDGATLWVDVFDTNKHSWYNQTFLIQSEVSALAQQLHNAIDKYYNEELLEKVIL